MKKKQSKEQPDKEGVEIIGLTVSELETLHKALAYYEWDIQQWMVPEKLKKELETIIGIRKTIALVGFIWSCK